MFKQFSAFSFLTRLLIIAFFTVAHLMAAAQQPVFYGPLVGWTDLKKQYHATGDGKADDTKALQLALDELGVGNHSNVLYIPAGTYNISTTLTIKSRKGIAIYGANPLTTIIRWTGIAGIPMIALNGVSYSEYSRLTWDGNNKASVGYAHEWDTKVPYANSGSQHADEIFRNLGTGIKTGNNMDAECSVRRCRFYRCSKAGLSTQGPNALDWWIWDCYFEKCYTGVANNFPAFGAGNFHVYRSIFIQSVYADISLGNSNYFSFRNNISYQSNCFLNAQQFSNTSPITLQKNLVISDSNHVMLDLFTKGNVLLLDNQFIRLKKNSSKTIRMVDGFKGTLPDLTLIGNQFSEAPGTIETAGGRIIQIENKFSQAVKKLPRLQPIAFAPFQKAMIKDVQLTTPVDSIQKWINKAASTKKTVVLHFVRGNHQLSNTIKIPAKAPVVIGGDGFQTFITLQKKSTDTCVLDIATPANISIKNCWLLGNASFDGIVVHDNDLPGNRFYANQLLLHGATQHNLLVQDICNSRIRIENFQHSYSKQAASVDVSGSAGRPGSLVRLLGVAGVENFNSYNISKNGRILVYDTWFEGNVDQFVHTTGTGELYINGAKIAATNRTGKPFIRIDQFKGKMVIAQAILNSPGKRFAYSNTGQQDSLLVLGTLTWNNSDNTYLDIKNRALSNYGWINNRANPGQGSFPLENIGNEQTQFIINILRTIRATDVLPDANKKGGSMIMLERVMVEGARTGVGILHQK